MLTQRAKRILLPGISALFLALILACGTETAPVSPVSDPVKIVSEATTPQDTMAKDVMEKSDESMDKSTESMAGGTMDKSTETMSGESMEWASMPAHETLILDLSGLKPLQNGFHYEGWAIVNGAPVSTGKFNAGPDGTLVALNGSPISQGAFDTGVDLNSATTVVITIEPTGDNDAIPASTHYLSGSVSDGKASLSIAHSAALGDDFSKAASNYILATPTDGSGNNENSGIWFLDLSSGTPSVGLDLPSLPQGWVYGETGGD